MKFGLVNVRVLMWAYVRFETRRYAVRQSEIRDGFFLARGMFRVTNSLREMREVIIRNGKARNYKTGPARAG